MKVYTKTGDKGETGLLGGKRVSKNCLEIQAIGEVDELNAVLGMTATLLKEPKLKLFLQNIQRDLFKVGAELAGLKNPNQIIDLEKIGEMEKMIDEFWEQLPELKNFILPGGNAAGAHLHLARVICRRVERALVGFGQTSVLGNRLPKSEVRSLKSNLRPELYIYLNRLSDFLFASARWVNFKAGEEEVKV